VETVQGAEIPETKNPEGDFELIKIEHGLEICARVD
jgi:hypothetical protein